ncbi:hypothetical protein HBH72_146400 [Parastagonospora nodorum]|nr:hypothetical protein HBH72_146400 [Parastagonospora nodorum]
MATDMVDSLLMSLPLELRHKCFEYAAVGDTKPKNLLRHWFEKKEVKELVATTVAANPTGPAPTVVYQQEHDEEDSDVPQPDEDEEEQDGEDDEDGDGEDDEGEDGEDDESEDDNEEENQDGDGDGDGMADQAQAIQFAITQALTQAQYAVLPPPPASAAPTTTQPQTQTQHVSADDQANAPELNADEEEVGVAADGANAPAANITEEGSQDADGDETMTEEDQDGEEDAEDDGEADEAAHGGGGSAAAPQQPIPPPPVPVVAPARKWRHIPNFMRLTHCPPPVQLLLASKQLNNEAKNWFYDVAVLRINATGSFAHTSFFEEAFDQITEAAFSPMENVRKVEVLFSWDTTWLRADTTGCAEAIFPALLPQRSEFVHKILSQAPDLKDVIIHWHDSAEDNESANFMLDVLAPFHSLNAHLAIKEHYIAVNAKPNSRSIAGQRRVEFQAIMDAGLDRLF